MRVIESGGFALRGVWDGWGYPGLNARRGRWKDMFASRIGFRDNDTMMVGLLH
jgi:hypothetical protein